MEPLTAQDIPADDDARARARALWNSASRPAARPWLPRDLRFVMGIAAGASALGVLISAAALHAPATVSGGEAVLQPAALKWLILSGLSFLVTGGWVAVNSAMSHALRRHADDQ